MEEREFSYKLKEALNIKHEWFDKECLPNMLEQYRLVHSYIKNFYDLCVRRSLINDDPYRLDKRIVDIVIPEKTPIMEQEIPTIFGARLSDYETMLDYICTYLRFSVESLKLPTIKKLVDFNNFFDWDALSKESKNPNSKALATVIENARSGADGVTQSMLSDTVTKCGQIKNELNRSLSELAVYQKELYKCELRKDLFEHPSFNRAKITESAEAELAEIKRLYTKVMGKKPFYGDLIGEIIKEDHAADKEKRQEAVLNNIKVKGEKKVVAKKHVIEPKEVLMGAVLALGLVAPTITTLKSKLSENFDLLFQKKATFINKLIVALKKTFGIKDKDRVVILPLRDHGTGIEKNQKIIVADLLYEMGKKERICAGIGSKGPEYKRVEASSEDAVLMFLSKQISELQRLFNVINALDSFFKNEVDVTLRARVRGMQMDLSILRTGILKVNKKRGEYVSYKDETEQMKKLGIVDEEE